MAKSVGGSLRNGGRSRRLRGCDRGCGVRFASAVLARRPLFERIHQQLLRRDLLGKARPQERIVRRVFQQPPHEVRHAGNQLAERHVDPQAVAQVDERLLLGVGHAVEHLQLEAAGAAMPRCRATAMPWASERTLWLPSAGRRCSWLRNTNRVSRSKLASDSHFC